MNIRKSVMSDLPELERIYAYAREQMKKNGNPDQWGEKWPPVSDIVKDIEDSVGYTIENDGRICGAFMFFIGEEPTYQVIEDGEWLNNEPHGVIHRVASDGTQRGIVDLIVDYCNLTIPNLRIDTHHDNHIMQHLLEKNGFTKCGIIHVGDGSARIAYQRKIEK
ncbi:MAG: GNAT family N-acetyltransferase [Lachnospiraceae bacterium]